MTSYSRLVMFKPTKVCEVISVNCLFRTLFASVYVIMLLSDGYFQVLLVSAHSALSIPAGPLCTIEAIMIYISIQHCGTINVRNQPVIIYNICVGQNPIQKQMKESNTHSTHRIAEDDKDASRILNTKSEISEIMTPYSFVSGVFQEQII